MMYQMLLRVSELVWIIKQNDKTKITPQKKEKKKTNADTEHAGLLFFTCHKHAFNMIITLYLTSCDIL